MRTRRLALALLTALCLAGAAPMVTAAEAVGVSEAEPPAPRILVMVRLPPAHYRPGYDASGGYGDDVARGAQRRLAARIARAHGLEVVDNWPMPLIGVDCFVMTVPPGRGAEAVAADVSRHADVAWSEALNVYRTRAAAGADPLFLAQPATRRWHLAELHRWATGRGVTVAVIDSKIARAHPDLAGQVVTSANFVPGVEPLEEAHGTGVAGVIAAKADNGLGIAGVAPRARLMGLRACWQVSGRTPAEDDTLCDSLSLAKALHFAIERKAHVINLSLGGPPDRLLGQLLALGVARGATVVAAFDPNVFGGGFPASQPGVIAVGAERPSAAPPRVYVAPGRDVPTTEPGGRWNLVTGSSYAAAHVSGLVALVRERRGRADASALVVALGEIDACATLARAAGPGERVCALPDEIVASRRR